MKNNRQIFKVLFLIIFLIVCTSCSSDKVTDEQTQIDEVKIANADVENPELDFDGITMQVRRTNTLNPLLSEDETIKTAMQLVYQNIVSYTEDDKISLNLIESYEFLQEENTFIVKIKDNVMWQDGNVMNVDDFIYSYNLLVNAGENACYKNVIKDISSFTKQDKSTIKIVTKNPSIGSPYFLAFPVVPSHVKNELLMKDDVHLNTVIGNGIYENTAVSVNNTIYLEDSKTDDVNPNIKKIRLLITDNTESKYYGFEQSISNVLVSKVENWSKFHTNKSVNINPYNKMEMIVLGFNFDTEINNDVNFRKAIYCSIPFAQISESIYLKFCDQSRTLYPSNHFAFNESISSDSFDGALANEFLRKTAYSGEPINVIIQGDSKELNKTFELIKANLENIGVEINVNNLPYDEYMSALIDGEYDIYLGDYNMGVLPEFDTILGANNYSNYNNEGLVNLLNTIKTTKSEIEYKNVAGSIQNIVFNEKPIIPILHNNDALITDENIVTVKPSSYDEPFQNIASWTIK